MENYAKEILDKLKIAEERNIRIEGKIDDIQTKLSKLEAENQARKQENERLMGLLRIQNDQIVQLQRESKRKNIIIFGIDEANNEDQKIQEHKVAEVVKITGVEFDAEKDIVETKRIGKKEENKIRPIMVELRNGNKRIDILKASKQLKRTKFSINEDFPRGVQEQRKVLRKHLISARELGKRATMRYNKLIVNGTVYTVEELMRSQEIEDGKRHLGVTPHRKPGTRTTSERSPTEDDENKEVMKTTRTDQRLQKN